MHDLGTALLYIASLATLATCLLAFGGAALRAPGLLAASRHGLLAAWLLWLAMGACLLHGLLSHDFSNKYIAAYTDQDMPLAYLIAGFWGGEKGALLFWTIALTSFAVASVLRNRTQSQIFLGWVTGILAAAIVFFATLMVFESNPFEVFQAGLGPDDGKGMNPLLQNPLMAIHPPSLLTGYIAFTIPFAFGLAALITGQLDSQWLRDTRKWTLVSWLFLSLGLILGGAWAYEELGWGGFWMWDPVENAGLIPWFTATAFLHSVMIQERRNMLKRWNAVLVCLTFLLTIFGTFLTRSQLIDSVHAFADSTLAAYFLWYMAVIFALSTVAIAWRWRQLRADAELDAVLSREAFFVFNNVLLVGCAFVVLWGTLFGQISDARPVQDLYNAVVRLAGHAGVVLTPLKQRVQLGEPWFNQVMTPLGLTILALTGVGPLISWRRATRRNFRHNIARPLTFSALVTLVLALGYLGRATLVARGARGLGWLAAATEATSAVGGRELYGAATIWFATFVAWAIAREFHIGTRARQRSHGHGYGIALLLLTLRNRRRYGGYIVHLGVVFCFLAFAGNAFRIYQPEIALFPGDMAEVGDYTLTFAAARDDYEADGAFARHRAEIVVMTRDEAVPEPAIRAVEALLGPGTTVQTVRGQPVVTVTFADATAGRAFASRQFVGQLGDQIAILGADRLDPRLLHLGLGPRLAAVAAVTPQVVMAFLDGMRAWAADTAVAPVEVRTTPGQPQFDLRFPTPTGPTEFLAAWRAGPWPGLRYAALHPHATPMNGLRVDCIPDGVGTVQQPEVRFYRKHASPTTEVAIESRLAHDLYLAMRPAQGQRFVHLLAVVFPFVSFLWLGAITMLLGATIAMLPSRAEGSAAVRAAGDAQNPPPDSAADTDLGCNPGSQERVGEPRENAENHTTRSWADRGCGLPSTETD